MLDSDLQVKTANSHSPEADRVAPGVDPDGLISRAVKLIADRFGFYFAGVFLIDDTRRWADLRAAAGEAGIKLKEAGHRISLDDGSAIAAAIATGRPQIVEQAGPPTSPILGDTRKELALPLIAGGRTFGALDVQRTDGAPLDDRLRLTLQSLADQIALALLGAQLATDVAQERERLILADEAGRALTAEVDRDGALAIALQMAPRLGATHSYILLIEPGDHLYFKTTIPGLSDLADPAARDFARMIFTRGVERWVLDKRQPALIADTRADPRWYTSPESNQDRVARAAIAVPLFGPGEKILGVLSYSHPAPGHFDAPDVRLVELLGRYLTIALENARLFATERRRAAEAVIVRDTLRALSANFDITDTFRVVAAGLRDLTGCDRVSLALLDPGGASFHIAAVDNGLPGLEKGRRLPVTATSAGLDLLAGRPHLTPDIASELGLPAEQAVYAAGYRSRMSVPLLVGERVSGALNLQWRDAEGFDTAHLPLLAQIADAIALAVENAQLFESVARERGRLELVSMISQELAANLDQRAVAENALRLVTGALDAFAESLANAAVFTIESGSDRLELIAATGVARDRLEEIDRAAHLRIGEGLVGWSAANRRIAIASDVDLDERWRYVPDIDQGVKSSAAVPLLAGTELVGVLSLTSSATGAFTPEHHPLLIALATPLALALQNARLFAAERERVRNLTLQTEVSRALADSMNLDDLLPAVSKYLAAIVDATGAAVVVWDAERQTVLPAASYGETAVSLANLQPEPGEPSLAEHVIRTGQPAIIEDASRSTFIGARFAERLSDKSLLGVPLIARGRTIGAALIGESRRLRLFTPEELDRVMGLAGQIALAVDNAQLFTSLGRHLSQILEMKQLQDNVFASIAAGVVTTEADGKVSLVNPAAERILGLPAIALVGQPAQVVLSALGESILSLAEVVRKFGVSETGHEVTINYPLRGTVHLNVSLTPLPGADGKGAGVTFVLEDVTEQRRLEIDREHIRRTFERVVPPGVVETLLADSANLQLGGRRQEITIMFADVRGFTSFAEQTAPEALIDVLNAFLDVAAQAVLEQGGTIDKFLGDGVMAIFNAPLPQAAHTLHAVRAAVRMRDALSPHRNLLEKTFPLNFSIGIAVGEAVVGNIGTSALFNYTAVGDIVNLAKRLQENAAGGQILLNEMAYQHVGDFVEARPLQPLRVKGRTALEHVYEVVRVERMVVR